MRFATDLFWLRFSPVVLPLLTDEHALLGSVHQHVKWHEGNDAGQTEAAGINLHTNLKVSEAHR